MGVLAQWEVGRAVIPIDVLNLEVLSSPTVAGGAKTGEVGNAW